MRNTILTGAASYLQMGSQVLTRLIAIPLALHFLDNERFGLWSFIAQSLGYLLLLDLGVGHSLGRLLAEPLHNGNEQEWNGWFNLALILFAVQAALILGLGLFFVDPILHWFPIPEALFQETRELWLMMLVLNTVMLPMRVFRGIVTAQNRSYWLSGGTALGAWCGLIVFYTFLRSGWGLLSYGWSATAQMVVSMGLPLVATIRGPHRFHLSWRNIPWQHLRELFGFSTGMFTMSIAVQITFMSQSLIIMKILGPAAVASFTVCSRVPMLLIQFVWQAFDAFIPRWQIFWAKGQKTVLTEEFRRMFRFTIGLAAVAMVCSFAMNRWFVLIFAKQELYAGKTFDFCLALFAIVPVWNHCLSNCFVIAKRLKGLAAIVVLNSALLLIAGIAGTKWFGLTGYVAFNACYSLAGIGLWYLTLKGPGILGLRRKVLVRDHALTLLVSFGLMAIGLLLFHEIIAPMRLLLAEIALSLAALAWFLGNFRKDLLVMLGRIQRARQKYLSVQSESPPVV